MFESESSSDDGGWIQWFCDLEGHEFFVEVEFDYIKDTFNLYGLKERIPRFNEAMKMILSSDSPDSEDLNDASFLEVYQSAMDLYGLIHARYIISPRGLTMMREKYVLGTFGSCQRILCDRQLVLPIGLSEELSTSRVKVSIFFRKSKFYLNRLIVRDVKKYMCLVKNIQTLMERILDYHSRIFFLKHIQIFTLKMVHSLTYQLSMVLKYLDRRDLHSNINTITTEHKQIKKKQIMCSTIKLRA